MIEIKEAKTFKQRREFLNFPLKLYKGNPYYVPPLYGDEKKIFRKDYLYYDQSEAIYFNAYKDGKMVGRISGILQKAANEKWKQKRVRFTRWDTIDDLEVSQALFKAVEDWAKEKGMEEVVGPLGFSDMEREGLLIEGFNELSTYEETYTYDYYPKHIDALGYQKEVDWTERKLFAPKEVDPRIKKISDMMLARFNLHLAEINSTDEFIKVYGRQFFDIVDRTYNEIYQTVPFTERQIKNLIKTFRLVLDKKRVPMVLDENNRVVAFGLGFPSISKAVQKSSGHLTPGCLLRLLKAIKHPEILDFGLIGVLPEYKNTGIDWAILCHALDFLVSGEVSYAETNLNLENNLAIQNTWSRFDSIIHKRRRSYVKKIS